MEEFRGLTNLWFPRFSSLTFLKIDVTIPENCISLLEAATSGFQDGWDKNQAEPKGKLQRRCQGKALVFLHLPGSISTLVSYGKASWLDQGTRRRMAGLGKRLLGQILPGMAHPHLLWVPVTLVKNFSVTKLNLGPPV